MVEEPRGHIRVRRSGHERTAGIDLGLLELRVKFLEFLHLVDHLTWQYAGDISRRRITECDGLVALGGIRVCDGCAIDGVMKTPVPPAEFLTVLLMLLRPG